MCRKITEIISGTQKFTYSFELTPDINVEDIENLEIDPLFYSITWHAKLYAFENLDIAPLRLVEKLRNKKKTVLLHLSCDKLRTVYLDKILDYLKSKGVCNLFVLLGEGFDANSSDFKSTSELISYIRKHSGNYFCIGVAGHCEKEASIGNLKEKVNSGADFILTQAFFDADIFKSFYTKCRSEGIVIPIIPGVFPYESYQEIDKFINTCKISVEESLVETIKNYGGIDIIKGLVHQIYSEMDVKHFHFFTLNKLERALKIITIPTSYLVTPPQTYPERRVCINAATS
ncbi:methylenetetrahydrofolate reductase 2 [Zerene cesonia]|uniref:methylenetetrahydrofolate reductase 2 n=1 Tax=Zerene cesonia TaxID=33412 RepID=UPI0018E57799|nr:methylenetetrahydrofolate reductase 2 [Zerene cesonia]